jgi:ATP-dependent DNA helicase RecG
MTATPIPRTLALGLFGEISITTIKNKPNNRLPIKTWIITEKRFQNSFSWLKQKIEADQKIFVVCPFIEESKTNSTIKSATKIHHFYQKLFGHLTTVSLIHGRLKPEEKTKTLEDFQSQKSHLLISTPIIEVGIDIPQANIIIIHSAERFGLAQLHQLRGRVGRGHEQGYCLLIPTNEEQTETERLNLLTKHNNGLTLAKLDLKLRGTGEIAGIKQHGRFSVRLKYFWNRSLFQTAKKISSLLLKKNPSQAKIIAQQLSDW